RPCRSMSGHRRSDLLDRCPNPNIEQLPAELRRGLCWIADDAPRVQREGLIAQTREIDALRAHRHQLRRIDDARMLADIGAAFALAQQSFDLRAVRIVGVDMDHANAALRPFGTEARRHLGLRPLAAAVVSDEADGPEPARFEAARNALAHR